MEKFLSLTLDNAKDIRNIYNQKEIENFIDEIISKKEIQEGNLGNWLKSNLRNYIIKERPIKLIESLSEVVEDWAISGVKNQTLSNVILDKQFQDQLLHVIDYLRTEYENKDLSRLTIPEAIKQSIDWTNNQKKVDDDEKGRTKILDCGDGYSIVEMFTQQALEYEGYAMKHCIGQYCVKPVLEKVNRAFSLRDENNVPHVTILYDLDGEVIKEIKGNSNSVVKEEYQKYLLPFLNSFPFRRMEDYDYIPKTDYVGGDFYFTDKPPASRLHQTIFEVKQYRLNTYVDNFVNETVRDEIIINHINNHDTNRVQNPILRHKFMFLTINSVKEAAINKLNLLNAYSLTINAFEHLSKINNPNVEIFNLKNNERPLTISKIQLDNAKVIKINPLKKLTIKTLDLSNAKNLNLVRINNCTINELILPENINNIELDDTIIENINSTNIEKLKLIKSTINNKDINCRDLYCFESFINSKVIKNNCVTISDKDYRIETPNNINNIEQKINYNILKDDLTAKFDITKALIIPDIFKYPGTSIKLEEINKKILSVVKPEYVDDVNRILTNSDLVVRFFEYKNLLDLNYLTLKEFRSSNARVKNDIILKKEFAHYLKNEETLYEFILFEHLRIFQPRGMNLNEFSELTIKTPHQIIKTISDKIIDNPLYMLNEQSYMILDNGRTGLPEVVRKDHENLYFKTISDFEEIENKRYARLPASGITHLFASKLFEKFWEESKNFKYGLNSTRMRKTEQITSTILKNNQTDIEKVFQVIGSDDNILFTNKNKTDLLMKIFTDMNLDIAEIGKKSINEVFLKIYDLDKVGHFSREDIIRGLTNYKVSVECKIRDSKINKLSLR